MPIDALLTPWTLATLTAAGVALLGTLGVHLADRLARWRPRTTADGLLREPGARFRLARRRALADALACALGAFAGVLAGGIATLVGETPIWASSTGLVVALAMVSGLALRSATFARQARRLQRRRRLRRAVAQHLSSIGGEKDRLFHDVNTGDGRAIDHVLVGANGAFAVTVIDAPEPGTDNTLTRHGDRLHCEGRSASVDLATLQRRVNALQHALSKPFGRMLRLRSVVCVPGWRVERNLDEGPLIVGARDVVMLKGWRNASDGFMHEEVDALHALLTERDAELAAPARSAAPVQAADARGPQTSSPAPA